MALLELERISAQYPGAAEPVLADISLSLGPQQLLVALGPSGSGKTSLLNLIAGFVSPSAGRITLDGVPVQGPSAERGVVFQDDALMPWLNALDNVALGLRLRGLGRREREARAREMLELVGLAQHAEHAIGELSGGQRQRLGLARALAVDPDFLLLDEPFGALDALTRERMQVLLLDVWKRTGKGLFLITHSVDEALFLATELLVLDGPPARIVRRLEVPFARRYLAGEPVRAIKADPRFAELRQELLDLFLQESPDHAL